MKWEDVPRSATLPKPGFNPFADGVVYAAVIKNLMGLYGDMPGVLGFEVGLDPSNINRLCIRAYIDDMEPTPPLPDMYLGVDIIPILTIGGFAPFDFSVAIPKDLW